MGISKPLTTTERCMTHIVLGKSSKLFPRYDREYELTILWQWERRHLSLTLGRVSSARPSDATLSTSGFTDKYMKWSVRASHLSQLQVPSLFLPFPAPNLNHLCILLVSRQALPHFFKALSDRWSQPFTVAWVPPMPVFSRTLPLPLSTGPSAALRHAPLTAGPGYDPFETKIRRWTHSAYPHFLLPAPCCNPENLRTISYYCFYSDFILPKCLFLVLALLYLSWHMTWLNDASFFISYYVMF